MIIYKPTLQIMLFLKTGNKVFEPHIFHGENLTVKQ